MQFTVDMQVVVFENNQFWRLLLGSTDAFILQLISGTPDFWNGLY